MPLASIEWEIFKTQLEKYLVDSDTDLQIEDEDYGEETGETEKRELIGGDFIG